MTRIVRRPVAILSWNGEYPCLFSDEGQIMKISCILDSWIEFGNWWENEQARKVYRVWTENQSVCDLECASNHVWYVYKVWD